MAKEAHTALAVDEVKRSQEHRVRNQRTQLVDSFLDFSQVYRSASASGRGRGLTVVLVDRAHDGLHDVSQTRGGRHRRALRVSATLSGSFGKSRSNEMAPCDYLFVFAQAHEEYRVPELRSIAELHGFQVGFDRYDTTEDLANAVKRPFMILRLEEEEHARRLANRCILIKYAQRPRPPRRVAHPHQVDLRILRTGVDLR